MRDSHFYDAGGYIDRGDADSLFPTSDLSGHVYTHRDAELLLGDLPSESVVVVRPTGLASSYALTQRALCAIEIGSLDGETLDELQAASGLDLTDFEFVQVGRQTTESANRSLGEFRSAETFTEDSADDDGVR